MLMSLLWMYQINWIPTQWILLMYTLRINDYFCECNNYCIIIHVHLTVVDGYFAGIICIMLLNTVCMFLGFNVMIIIFW